MPWFFIHGFRSAAEPLEVTPAHSLNVTKLEGFGAPLPAQRRDRNLAVRGCLINFGKRLGTAQAARELPGTGLWGQDEARKYLPRHMALTVMPTTEKVGEEQGTALGHSTISEGLIADNSR